MDQAPQCEPVHTSLCHVCSKCASDGPSCIGAPDFDDLKFHCNAIRDSDGKGPIDIYVRSVHRILEHARANQTRDKAVAIIVSTKCVYSLVKALSYTRNSRFIYYVCYILGSVTAVDRPSTLHVVECGALHTLIVLLQRHHIDIDILSCIAWCLCSIAVETDILCKQKSYRDAIFKSTPRILSTPHMIRVHGAVVRLLRNMVLYKSVTWNRNEMSCALPSLFLALSSEDTESLVDALESIIRFTHLEGDDCGARAMVMKNNVHVTAIEVVGHVSHDHPLLNRYLRILGDLMYYSDDDTCRLVHEHGVLFALNSMFSRKESVHNEQEFSPCVNGTLIVNNVSTIPECVTPVLESGVMDHIIHYITHSTGKLYQEAVMALCTLIASCAYEHVTHPGTFKCIETLPYLMQSEADCEAALQAIRNMFRRMSGNIECANVEHGRAFLNHFRSVCVPMTPQAAVYLECAPSATNARKAMDEFAARLAV